MSRRGMTLALALACAGCGATAREVAPPERATAAHTERLETATEVRAQPAIVPPSEAQTEPETEPAATTAAPPPSEAPASPTVVTFPAPAAPGRDGAPIESLAPWTFDATLEGQLAVIAPALGAPLIAFDGERFFAVAGDGTSPTVARDNPLGFHPVFADETLPPGPVADGAFLVRGTDDVVAAVDVATLDVRWTARLGVAVGASYEAHLSSGDAFLVVARDDLVALDPATGAVLWRTSFPRARHFSRGQSWRAARGLFVALDDGLAARDARTGEVRWRAAGFDSRTDRVFDPDGELLPIVQRDVVVVVSLADGSERARVPLPAIPGRGRTVVLRGDELYVALPPRRDGHGALVVHRYDLARPGAARWRSETFATLDDGFHPSLTVDDDAVLVCTTTWFARGLGRADGRERWSDTARSCGMPILWRPREGAPNVVFLSPRARDARARADAPVSRRVTVSGVVRCDDRTIAGARAWVGGERVRTDARGRYRATARVGETIALWIEQHDLDEQSFCQAARRELPVTGARMTSDFALTLAYDHDPL